MSLKVTAQCEVWTITSKEYALAQCEVWTVTPKEYALTTCSLVLEMEMDKVPTMNKDKGEKGEGKIPPFDLFQIIKCPISSVLLSLTRAFYGSHCI